MTDFLVKNVHIGWIQGKRIFADVQLKIDLFPLAQQLGAKAKDNKYGKSRAHQGAVIAVIDPVTISHDSPRGAPNVEMVRK